MGKMILEHSVDCKRENFGQGGIKVIKPSLDTESW